MSILEKATSFRKNATKFECPERKKLQMGEISRELDRVCGTR